MVSRPGQDGYFQNENDDVFPSVCSQQCNDAANRRLMEYHAEDVYILTVPLGLDLQITESLVNSIQNAVNNFHHQPTNLGLSSPLKYNELVDHDKLRASCLSASTIKIGSWERKSANVSDLVMKIYFAKRRVVWELLQDNRRKKNKIEIRWNDIIGIRVTIGKDKAEALEVELACPPSLMEEMEPEPRKHTIWLTSNDFTNGQASICRRHMVTFHPGTLLRKNIQKMFLVDPRLHRLSMKGFPTVESPRFERRPTLFPFFDFKGVFQPLGGFPYYPINKFPMAAVHSSLQQLPSPISDQHFLHDGGVYVNPSLVPGSRSNADGLSGGQVHGIASNVAPSTLVSPALYYDPIKIKPINNRLQNDIKNVSSRTVKQSSQSIDSWNAMLNGSRDGSHHGIRNPPRYEHGSNSTVDDNVPITPDSQVYQTALGMPPSLSHHVHGIKEPPHYEHDSSSSFEDYATLKENVPVPDFQFYQTASGMPPPLFQVQPAMRHQNWGNLAYDPNAIAPTGYNSFGGHGAHLFREREEKQEGG